MRRFTTFLSAAAILLALGTLAGCGPTNKGTPGPTGKSGKPGVEDHAGHSHDAHLHGPNGGEVVELANPDAKDEYHAEWITDDDAGKLTVWLLDKDLKKEVGTSAEELFIDVKTGEPATTSLKAANRTDGDMPTATRFEVVDQGLLTVLANEKIDAVMRVSINGVEFSGKVVRHKH